MFSKKIIVFTKEIQVDYNKWKGEQSIKNIQETELQKIYTAYINLKDMLNDDDEYILHQNMWGILCSPGVLFETGLNLYLFNVDVYSDEYKTQYICPPNGDHDEYYKDNIERKSSFMVCSYNSKNKILSYEICSKITTDTLGNISRKSIKLFERNEIFEILIYLRQNCIEVKNTEYINYMKNNNFFIELINYEDLIQENLTIKGQYMNLNFHVSLVLVEFEKITLFIPIKQRGYIYNIPIITKNNIKQYLKYDLKEIYGHYKYINKSIPRIKCQPLKYTVSLENGHINGLVLNTNKIIPIKEMPINHKLISNLKLIKDERINNEFDNNVSNIKNEHNKIINNYNKFWNNYNLFCYEFSNHLSNGKS